MITERITAIRHDIKHKQKKKPAPFAIGIGITLVIAIAAKYIALLPGLGIIGPLVIAILLGMGWRAALPVPETSVGGIHFASKSLLRAGIILLGMRLNLYDIVQAGPKVFAIAAFDLVFAFFVVYALCRFCKVERTLGILTACGTAICGAAAVAAISSQVKANEKETAIGVATIAVLGTIFTLAYSLLYPLLGLAPYEYGVFAGGTLHEIAHVIAAGAAGGQQAMDISIIVKLTRVALLVPVALLIGWWFSRRTAATGGEAGDKRTSLPIPWFILGFLLLSGINTLGIVPAGIAAQMVALGYLLIAMAMAGLGLNIDAATFKRMGIRPFWAGLIGSVLLSVFGYVLVYFML
ncbi:YeiH family putative sulfate export transporter [Aneurinibacillus sp. BA2021]|nr:YeiH family putative sulfate export transporter [Aneurinibacillus sp. BA2021]